MKLSFTIAAAMTAGSVLAGEAESSVQDVIASLQSQYGTNADLKSWAEYVSTHEFTTPTVVASYLSKLATVTDPSVLQAALTDAPTKEIDEFVTQYYPGSILAVVSSLTSQHHKPTGAVTEKSASNGVAHSALPIGAVAGLSGLIISLILL